MNVHVLVTQILFPYSLKSYKHSVWNTLSSVKLVSTQC